MQVKIALIILLLLTGSNLIAEQTKNVMYIGYLKPYEKIEVKRKFRKDPTEEPSIKMHIKRDIYEPENLDLKGILFNPHEKKAFINGELYKEGDIVNGYKITRIFPDKVIVSKNNFQFEIKLE